ncbi:hypothetical protein VSH64_41535 [Amycolatopsis rhabdoformis]|uniref:Uncharacterized protein n=1 Tax=Amycolatopsis rhabdoformis TaxID=1448059 RepID=A0ABZ1I5I2_9PSEU|nr:hypothetical protein [Amycolatopsis rhabdoformis]WSE29226.1 hypothetical protein VSH64_41535 [Amycolatopsis rhabdoformis]
MPQGQPRPPIALPQPTRRADEPRDEYRVHEDYLAYQRGLAGQATDGPAAERGLTELPQPSRGHRGFTAGRLDEAGPVAEPSEAGQESGSPWSGARSGDLATAAGSEFPQLGLGIPAGASALLNSPAGQLGAGFPPVGATVVTAQNAVPDHPAGTLTGTIAPDFSQVRHSVPARQSALIGPASSTITPEFGSGERRVPTGQAVVPDPVPMSEVDRAWAAPGTTRSLADVPPHEGLGRPQMRRSRRERVAATAATLAQPQVDPDETEQTAQALQAELDQAEAEAAREHVDLSAAGKSNRAENPNREAQPEPPKRQRVTLRAPAVKARERGPFDEAALDEEEDEVRVYAAPLLDGLGKFDLGSVPASVTPPKTWRKAAWFATGASGAVVVGLLFAGTFLVGGPTTTTDALGGGWPGRQNGGNPLILPDPSLGQQGGTGGGPQDSSSGGKHRTADDSADSDPDTHPQNAVGSDTSEARTPTDSSSSDSSAPVTTGPTSTPAAPDAKPPVTPAQRETSPTNPFYGPAKNPKTMGDNTEKFFNTVTTDPNEAAAVTTGDLKQEGPQGLRQRYANVAYFEVKKVEIDPDSNTTVNTLEVTHTDGTKTIEQRTLTFGDDEKIADDGA